MENIIIQSKITSPYSNWVVFTVVESTPYVCSNTSFVVKPDGGIVGGVFVVVVGVIVGVVVGECAIDQGDPSNRRVPKNKITTEQYRCCSFWIDMSQCKQCRHISGAADV